MAFSKPCKYCGELVTPWKNKNKATVYRRVCKFCFAEALRNRNRSEGWSYKGMFPGDDEDVWTN